MRKKLLSLLTALMMLPMMGFAADTWDSWRTDVNNFREGNWSSETMVNTRIHVSGRSQNGYWVAAFIGDELRGVCQTPNSFNGGTTAAYIYSVRVKGESTDNGKTITFRIIDPKKGYVYFPGDGFTEQTQAGAAHTTTYTGETTALPSQAIVLNLTPIVDVEYISSSQGINVFRQDIADGYVIKAADPTDWSKPWDYYVAPEGASNKSVTMTLSDPTKGTLTETDGVWTFKPAADCKGNFSITVTSVVNSAATVEIPVTVKVRIESVQIKVGASYPSNYTAYERFDKVNLKNYYSVLPADADAEGLLGVEVYDQEPSRTLNTTNVTGRVVATLDGSDATNHTYIMNWPGRFKWRVLQYSDEIGVTGAPVVEKTWEGCTMTSVEIELGEDMGTDTYYTYNNTSDCNGFWENGVKGIYQDGDECFIWPQDEPRTLSVANSAMGTTYNDDPCTWYYVPANDYVGDAVLTFTIDANPNIKGSWKYNIVQGPTGIEVAVGSPWTVTKDVQVNINDYVTVLPANSSIKGKMIVSLYYNGTEIAYSQWGQYINRVDSKTDGTCYITFNKVGTYVVGVTLMENNGNCYDVAELTKELTFNVVIPVTDIIPWEGGNTYYRQDLLPNGINLSERYDIVPGDATDKSVTMAQDQKRTTCAGTLAKDARGNWIFKPAADAKGAVYVTITSVSNPEVSAVYDFIVGVAVESVTAKQTSMTVPVESVTELADLFTVLPEDADDLSLDFTVTSGTTVGNIITNGSGVDSFEALTAGTATVTATSVMSRNNVRPSATMQFIVKPYASTLKVELDPSEYDTVDPTTGETIYRSPIFTTRTVTVTPIPEGSYIIDLLSDIDFTFNGESYHPYSWISGDKTDIVDNQDGTYTFTITPYMPNSTEVTVWDGGLNIETCVQFMAFGIAELSSGWNWISTLNDNSYIAGDVYDTFGDNLFEARTENYYLVNDPEWGYFGGYEGSNDIPMHPTIDNGHIRVKLKSDATFYDGKYRPWSYNPNILIGFNVHKGWNWIHSMSFYPVPISCIDTSEVCEGDIIKSKGGLSATFSNGAWHGTLSSLMPQNGYAYLSNTTSDDKVYIGIGEEPDQPTSYSWRGQRHAPAKQDWEYDGSRFMNNMNIIADIPQLDVPEDYTIGTFVNGECRGEGKYVDDRWFIFAHGDASDKVTFKLKNRNTGAICDLNEVYDFCELAGSYKAPESLSGNGISGIMGVSVDTNVYVSGNAIIGDDVEIYDLNGRRLTELNGRLLPGIYVVTSNGVTQKITIK